jgi:site-specific recombinase
MPSTVRAAILRCLEGKVADSASALELTAPLDALLHAPSVAEAVDAWIDLTHWTRARGGRLLRQRGPWPPSWERLDFYLEVVTSDPALLALHHQALLKIVHQAEMVSFFAECGIPSDRGTLPEVWEGLMRLLLPQPRADERLSRLLERLFPTARHAERFRDCPAPLFARLAHAMLPLEQPDRLEPLRQSLADAFRILAARVQAQFFSEALRARGPSGPVKTHPAHQLAQLSERLADAWLRGEALDSLTEAWSQRTAECATVIEHILQSMESSGISVDLIHAIETVRLCLVRMEMLQEVMRAPDRATALQRVHTLLGCLISANLEERHPLRILSSRTALLHRKIVERAGETGSHYIASQPGEYAWIWRAAAGGGLLTVVTAAIKLWIHEWHGLSPLVAGLAAGLNYAFCFLILHHAHLILATKQPAMTAAHLARILRKQRGEERLHEVSTYAAKICHSQLAAAAGNVLAVSLGAVALDAIWRAAIGTHIIHAASASQVLHSLSLSHSGTLFFAAWTGVLLWLASLAGGWIDNWSAYHQLPAGIASLPPRGPLTRAFWTRAGNAVRRHISGWGTNISLGLLLGLSPALGQFIGIPLEVRHVTLSAGQLALAASALEKDWLDDGFFFRALAGIAAMFILNLSVSFLCSLFTAARAYQLSARETATVLGHIIRSALLRPRDFLLPPRA